MASTYLTRTPASATNRQTWTWSGWVKLSQFAGGAGSILFSAYAHAADNFKIAFSDTFKLSMRFYNNTEYQLNLNRLFRDTSGWYHLVFAVDTTLATEADRFRIYVNGVRETSFGQEDQPTQNLQMTINEATATQIGRYSTGDNYFNGSMSHIHFIDGTAYDASAFGETDATTGIWKPKTNPSVTYGTNGFFLKFENSGAFGTDSSGNANTFTVNGTMTQNIDTPSNVFATLNPLARFQVAPTYSNGNNTITAGAGGSGSSPFSTIGASSGKYYAELSLGSVNGGGISCGIIDITQFNPNFQTDAWFYYPTYGYAYMSSNGNKGNNNAETSYANSYTNGDRIGVAMDLDNNKLYFAKNGVWQNSGDPTSGATGTGAAFTIADGTYGFAVYGYDSKVWNANFGNGYFGTTAVSSAQNPDDGIGIFEYDVPTGYYALNTKAINAQEYD